MRIERRFTRADRDAYADIEKGSRSIPDISKALDVIKVVVVCLVVCVLIIPAVFAVG